jgi:hypothetical protein
VDIGRLPDLWVSHAAGELTDISSTSLVPQTIVAAFSAARYTKTDETQSAPLLQTTDKERELAEVLKGSGVDAIQACSWRNLICIRRDAGESRRHSVDGQIR